MRFCGAEKTQLGLDHASPKRMCGVLLLPVSEKKTERIPHPNPYPALSPTPIPNPYPQPQPLVPSPPTLPRHINGGAAGIPCSCSWRCTEASKIALCCHRRRRTLVGRGTVEQLANLSLKICYPLVNIQQTMENHHFLWEIPL